MKKDFTPNTVDVNAQILADMLPGGRLFDAKNINGSNFRKMLEALAQELTRIQIKIYEISTEDDLETTTNLIEQWEKALGIPDECFSNTVSIDQRRKQIVAKFAKMNVQTEDDFISLAKYFGYNITISYGDVHGTFPITFPWVFALDGRAARHTMIIRFVDINKPGSTFPWIFPVVWGEPNIIICLFEHLKPANVKIVWQYKDTF